MGRHMIIRAADWWERNFEYIHVTGRKFMQIHKTF
jgi:hypothetical protein